MTTSKKNRTKARGVRVSPLVPKRGRPLIWGYGVADLAVLFGMEERAVRRAIERETFDPASLASVVAFAEVRRQERARDEVVATALMALAPTPVTP